MVGDVLAEQFEGLGVVEGAGAVVDGVGGPAVPAEERGFVGFLDVGARGSGELVGRNPGLGSGSVGAVVGGVEELADGPGAGGAAADAEGVQEGPVVGAEVGGGPQDAGAVVGSGVVGMGPVVGADEGYQEGPWWLPFGGEETVEGVGPSGDGEGEAVEDSVSSCLSGAVEGLCELGQVGHWPVPFRGRGGWSVVASSGSGLLFPRSRGPVGAGASSGLGGRASGLVLSRPAPIVPVICGKNPCNKIRGDRL